MSYLLATTETRVRWYQIDFKARSTVLHEVLDLNVVTQFADKESAKDAAKGLGLQTWRYVQLR